ncbi:hypothetical protein C8R42DRAFT_645598 [Lentinula raphanica]|nr:hypothetical protein C8R42DRAFT_645598 [Lentinula raphanica]
MSPSSADTLKGLLKPHKAPAANIPSEKAAPSMGEGRPQREKKTAAMKNKVWLNDSTRRETTAVKRSSDSTNRSSQIVQESNQKVQQVYKAKPQKLAEKPSTEQEDAENDELGVDDDDSFKENSDEDEEDEDEDIGDLELDAEQVKVVGAKKRNTRASANFFLDDDNCILPGRFDTFDTFDSARIPDDNSISEISSNIDISMLSSDFEDDFDNVKPTAVPAAKTKTGRQAQKRPQIATATNVEKTGGMSLWPGRSHVGCPYDLGGPRWDVPMAWEVPGGMSLWPGRSQVGCPMWDIPMAWDVLFLMSGISLHLNCGIVKHLHKRYIDTLNYFINVIFNDSNCCIFEFSELCLREYDIDNSLTQYKAHTKIIECGIHAFQVKKRKISAHKRPKLVVICVSWYNNVPTILTYEVLCAMNVMSDNTALNFCLFSVH